MRLWKEHALESQGLGRKSPEMKPRIHRPFPRNHRISRTHRRYNLTPEGRERLSSLGKARWSIQSQSEKREAGLERREEQLEEAGEARAGAVPRLLGLVRGPRTTSNPTGARYTHWTARSLPSYRSHGLGSMPFGSKRHVSRSDTRTRHRADRQTILERNRPGDSP